MLWQSQYTNCTCIHLLLFFHTKIHLKRYVTIHYTWEIFKYWQRRNEEQYYFFHFVSFVTSFLSNICWVMEGGSERQNGIKTWWRHQMETFSAELAICARNSPVTGEFPTQRPVTRSFAVLFDLRLNIRLSIQWRGWWFETPVRLSWRHCNEEPKLNLKCNNMIWFTIYIFSKQK